MKALVVRGINNYEICEVDIPKPRRDEVLVRVKVAGFCRTDLKIIRNGHRDLVLPCIPGEEVVGEIVEVGEGVDGYALGERVYIYPGISCGVCSQCIKGAENLCSSMRIMGFHRPGGFSEYVISPVKSLVKIPDNLSYEKAVFAEPLSCVLNAIELSGLKPGESIGIWGGGPAGTLVYRASKALGAIPTVIEPLKNRKVFTGAIEYSETLKFDVALVAVGDRDAYYQALSTLKPRGRIVIFSGLISPDNLLTIDFNRIHYLEQTIVGTYGCSYRHAVLAINLLSNSLIKVEDLITHRISLSDIESAIDIVENKSGMKVLIYP